MTNPYGITANSTPVYDEWGFDDSWNCAMWLAWLDELQKVHTQWDANEIWLTAWDNVDDWDWQKRNCQPAGNFRLMLSFKGIETSDNIFFNDGAMSVVSNPTDYQNIEDNRPFDPLDTIEEAVETLGKFSPAKMLVPFGLAWAIYKIVK